MKNGLKTLIDKAVSRNLFIYDPEASGVLTQRLLDTLDIMGNHPGDPKCDNREFVVILSRELVDYYIKHHNGCCYDRYNLVLWIGKKGNALLGGY